MKTIQNYIQFAIDNGYEFPISNNIKIFKDTTWVDWLWEYTIKWFIIRYDFIPSKTTNLFKWNVSVFKSLTDIITSKEFIEAIAKWMEKEMEKFRNSLKEGELFALVSVKMFWVKWNWFEYKENFVDWVTTEQAIAIRDWELSKFINNILPTKD